MSANNTINEQEAVSDLVLYADAIEYFDTHDLGDELDSMPEVHFEINLPPRKARFALETALADKLRAAAQERGVSAETLLNQWVQEKTAEAALSVSQQ